MELFDSSSAILRYPATSHSVCPEKNVSGKVSDAMRFIEQNGCIRLPNVFHYRVTKEENIRFDRFTITEHIEMTRALLVFQYNQMKMGLPCTLKLVVKVSSQYTVKWQSLCSG
jgi:hypothetical protein